MVLGETANAAESVIGAFRGLKANFLVQEFVKEAAGSDLRCLVIGGKVVAAMKRQAQSRCCPDTVIVGCAPKQPVVSEKWPLDSVTLK